MLAACIRQCDVDFRRELGTKVFLTGGSTQLPNFASRVKGDLHALAATTAALRKGPGGKVWASTGDPVAPVARDVDVAVAAGSDDVWRGGTVLASLPRFQAMWVTRKEYEDAGSGVVHRKWL